MRNCKVAKKLPFKLVPEESAVDVHKCRLVALVIVTCERVLVLTLTV